MSTRTTPGRVATDADDQSPTQPPAPHPHLRTSLVAGLLAALLVLVAGAMFAATRPPEWTAETKLLVGPGLQADSTNISAYYETLSRGQVIATAAEIIEQPRFTRDAIRAVTGDDARGAETRVTVVPGTSLVSVSVTARTRATAEGLADEIAASSVPTVNQLLTPYAATPLGSAEDSATRSTLATSQLAAVVALMAAVVGAGVQQVVQRLAGGPRRGLRSTRP
jgi:capsular polysaccharide biosynthesis protein